MSGEAAEGRRARPLPEALSLRPPPPGRLAAPGRGLRGLDRLAGGEGGPFGLPSAFLRLRRLAGLTSQITADLAGDKDLTKTPLAEAALPVPPGRGRPR